MQKNVLDKVYEFIVYILHCKFNNFEINIRDKIKNIKLS